MVDYPKDWGEVTVDLVSPIRGGFAFKSEMYVKKGIPIVRISNILFNETIGGNFEYYKNLPNDNDFKLLNGSVVIAMSGATTGKVALLKLKNEDFYYQNQRVGYFKKTENINNYFLSYVVRGEEFKRYVSSILSTGAQPNISPKQINMFRFSMPSISEQKAIAETLMTFDRHIENLERLIEKKKMVRDGAVEDLMTGKTRLEGFEGDWEEITIGDFLEFKNGLNKGKDFFGYGTPIINYMDVYKNHALYKENIAGKVSLSNSEIERYRVKKGDVFFTRTSETPEEVGISSVLLDDLDNCSFSGFVLRGRPKSEKILPEYCKYCFGIKKVRNSIIENCTFTTRALTNGKQLSKIALNIPSNIKEQQAIASILTSMDEEIENLIKEKAKIEKIKAGAMDDLLTGKVRLI